jgi:hypothetical protein
MFKFLKKNNMAVISFIPKKKTIKDNRNPDGGYYIAKCELCGTEFYPKRSSAKYCSQSCRSKAYPSKPKNTVKTPEYRLLFFGSCRQTAEFLKDSYGVTKKSVNAIKTLDYGESTSEYQSNFDIDERFNIKRISANKYNVYFEK